MTLPILLDCDPGHDDALALMLALARPELEVLGLTTVAGNASLERTTENALRLLALLRRPDVPVAAGAARPLDGRSRTAEYCHGESGLEGAALPDPATDVVPEPAVAFLAERILAAPAPVTLVATGPLTNVAALLLARPDVGAALRGISIMGGGAVEGNRTPSAEFNVWADPEAARIVFRSGLPLTMMGLDVTHRALVRSDDLRRLHAAGGRVSALVADLLEFFADYHRRVYGWDGCPIHDAVPVAQLVDPTLVPVAPRHVDVEVHGELTRGRTVVDLRGTGELEPTADVGVDLDRDRFVRLLLDAVRSFDR